MSTSTNYSLANVHVLKRISEGTTIHLKGSMDMKISSVKGIIENVLGIENIGLLPISQIQVLAAETYAVLCATNPSIKNIAKLEPELLDSSSLLSNNKPPVVFHT